MLYSTLQSPNMASAKFSLKNMDYYRFRKLIIDGNRDEYGSCSKEVRSFCDNVQTFNFRDDEFDEEADRGRFDEICCYYRQILNGKRVNPIDMRIKSGWWGDQKGSSYSVGKIKISALKELLIFKCKEWAKRNGHSDAQCTSLVKKIDGPGIYVFKHRERQCFQFVGRSQKVFASCAEKLKLAYEGKSLEPLASLFLITLASDWEFYFTPVLANDNDKLLRILENDLIIRHDCIWPYGLNFKLQIDSLLEISEFRRSCIRYKWPPQRDDVNDKLELTALRKQLENLKQKELEEGENILLSSTAASTPPSSPRSSVADIDDAAFQALPSSPTVPFEDFLSGERPASPLSVMSTATYTVDSLELKAQKLEVKRPQRKIPKMGIMKGKENNRAVKNSARNLTASKAESAATIQTCDLGNSGESRQPNCGLLDYPIDESLLVKEKEGIEFGSGDDQNDDVDGNEDGKKMYRPSVLPIKSTPRGSVKHSPRMQRK